jgi:hypothetical protein
MVVGPMRIAHQSLPLYERAGCSVSHVSYLRLGAVRKEVLVHDPTRALKPASHVCALAASLLCCGSLLMIKIIPLEFLIEGQNSQQWHPAQLSKQLRTFTQLSIWHRISHWDFVAYHIMKLSIVDDSRGMQGFHFFVQNPYGYLLLMFRLISRQALWRPESHAFHQIRLAHLPTLLRKN